jgi:hypothetical protein
MPVRHAIPAGLLVLALAGCGGSAAGHVGQSAHTSTPASPVVQHPSTGCWTVARPYIDTLAHDLAKQAKLLHQIVKGNPAPLRAQVRATTLRAEAGAWLPPGIYAADLNPFDQFSGFTCESGSIEDTKYPSEAPFDSNFNGLLNDISALQDNNGDVPDYRSMRQDVAAVEADYQQG